MKTTAVVAEHIISGMLLVSWIIIIIAEDIPNLGVGNVMEYGFSLIPVTIIALGVLYFLGVVSDRISDILTSLLLFWLPKMKLITDTRVAGLSLSDKNRIKIWRLLWTGINISVSLQTFRNFATSF